MKKIKYNLHIPGMEKGYENLETDSLPRVGEIYTLTDFIDKVNRGIEVKKLPVKSVDRVVLIDTSKKTGKSKVTSETITITL